jgi:hypothetical protein
LLVPWLERAPAWTIGFPLMACHATETLWLLGRLDHADVIERSLLEKVIRPDFRYAMVDGRLALARLHTLQAHWEEAEHWFAGARRVLEEQGARLLLAIASLDEARMSARRGSGGDARQRGLTDAALRDFHAMGMTGWIRQVPERDQLDS